MLFVPYLALQLFEVLPLTMPRGKTLTNELLSVQRGEIMKVGFLRKKGHVRRNWLDRWFVLTSEGLYYYKNRMDPRPIGVIPLFGVTVKEDTFQRHQNVLTCWTAEGKDYPIQASTRDEMLVWIKAIDEAVANRNTRPREYKADVTENPAVVARRESKQEMSPQKQASSTKGAVGGANSSDEDDDD